MPTPTGTTAPPQAKTLESRVPGSVMVDVAAPPVPNRNNPLRKPTHAEATSKLKTGMGILIFGLVVGGALGLAVASYDEEIPGRESRAVCGIRSARNVGEPISDANSKGIGERPRQRRKLARHVQS